MSLAPKSNAVDVAYMEAKNDAERMLSEPVPLYLRNAETKLMKDLDYGKGYIYAHNTEEKVARMTCLPDSLKNKEYYHPTKEGRESTYKERLDLIKNYKKGKVSTIHKKKEK